MILNAPIFNSSMYMLIISVLFVNNFRKFKKGIFELQEDITFQKRISDLNVFIKEP